MARTPNVTPDPSAVAAASKRHARRRRLERELRSLHALAAWSRGSDVVWAVLTIGALGALWLALFAKFRWLTGSLLLALPISAVLGAAVWWAGRSWFVLAYLIVAALLLLVFEDAIEPPDWPEADRASKRRAKLEAAIAKREALLRRWSETTP